MFAWAAYVLFVVQVVFRGLRIGSFFLTAALVCFLFLFLVYWSFRELSKPPKGKQLKILPPAADPSDPAAPEDTPAGSGPPAPDTSSSGPGPGSPAPDASSSGSGSGSPAASSDSSGSGSTGGSSAAPGSGTGTIRQLSFKVAGVTFPNDDGSDRQEILRHLYFGDPPFADDPEDLLVDIQETSYNGELAFAVFINGYQVGNVPRAKIAQVQLALSTYSWTVDDVKISGGGAGTTGEPIPWGCRITGSYML